MKNTRRYVALILVVVMSAAILVGCSGGKSTDYLNWTSKEWDKASESEQINAAIELLKLANPEVANASREDQEAGAKMILSMVGLYLSLSENGTKIKDIADQFENQ